MCIYIREGTTTDLSEHYFSRITTKISDNVRMRDQAYPKNNLMCSYIIAEKKHSICKSITHSPVPKFTQTFKYSQNTLRKFEE